VALPARRARVSLRQLVLFVLSMVVPSIVLVGLGVRIIVQQEELADKHVTDQQRLRANEFERALATELDRIRVDPHDPAVAVVATIVDGRLILPWDTPSRTDTAADPAFSARIARAEREEFATGRLDVSLSELDAALEIATSDRQRAYARLLRARVFAKARRSTDADGDYRALLTVPLSIEDEDGMPFAFYAADRLLTSGHATDADRQAIAALADAAAQASSALPPAAWYLLRRVDDAVSGAADEKSRARRDHVARRIADVEHALALQRDIQALLAGVRISAASSGGGTAASISACGGSGQISLTAGDDIVVTCGSVTIVVLAGAAEITYLADDGSVATVTLDQGNSLTFEPVSGTLTTPVGNTAAIVVHIGGIQLHIEPGRTVGLVMQVVLDVKPGTSPNSINLGSAGTVPAAILSTPGFTAPAEVDPDSLSLIGATVNLIGKAGKLQCNGEDVNGDGLADLVCHFVTTDLGLQIGDSVAVLLGQTFGGRHIRGEDIVRVVP
jgi:hypothetical protein